MYRCKDMLHEIRPTREAATFEGFVWSGIRKPIVHIHVDYCFVKVRGKKYFRHPSAGVCISLYRLAYLLACYSQTRTATAFIAVKIQTG